MRKYLESINCVVTMIKFDPLKITLEVSVNKFNKFSENIFQCKSMDRTFVNKSLHCSFISLHIELVFYLFENGSGILVLKLFSPDCRLSVEKIVLFSCSLLSEAVVTQPAVCERTNMSIVPCDYQLFAVVINLIKFGHLSFNSAVLSRFY